MAKRKSKPDLKHDKKLIGLVAIALGVIVVLFVLSEVTV